MKIKLPYGLGHIAVDIPEENILDIIKIDDPSPPQDEKTIILNAMKKPISSRPLSRLARRKKNAAILVSDVTRPCPSHKFLPFILDELEEARVSDIKIIFGLGIHRKQTEDEKRMLVGEQAIKRIRRLVDSNEGLFRFIGHTKAGTPVEVCEEVLASDLLIVTGNLEYHYFAGYSGGAKAAAIGVCSPKTIQANHSLMLDDRAVTGSFKHNPLRQDIEEAGQMIGIDFLFNAVLDDKKRIISAFAGSNNEAYREGIKRYDQIYRMVVGEKADVVIAATGAYPKDLNLYQAQKALENVKDVVKETGEIILISSCDEGYGNKIFEEWMRKADDYHTLETWIKKKFVLGGHKAYALSKLLAKTRVALYSSFSREDSEKMGFIKINNLQDYLDDKIRQSKDTKILIIPTGCFVQHQG